MALLSGGRSTSPMEGNWQEINPRSVHASLLRKTLSVLSVI